MLPSDYSLSDGIMEEPRVFYRCVMGDCVKGIWSHGVIENNQAWYCALVTVSNTFSLKLGRKLIVVWLLSCLQLFATHGLHHARLPCPSLSPKVCSNSCPLSQWCHSIISSYYPLLLLLSVFPSIRVFSSESALHIRKLMETKMEIPIYATKYIIIKVNWRNINLLHN